MTGRVSHKHAAECYSASKRKGILTLATSGMNLGDLMPSEIRQSRKDGLWMLPLTRGTQSGLIRKAERW